MALQSDISAVGSCPPVPSTPATVLIVDDDDAIRVLAQWVVQRAGFPVLTARDGPEAIEIFRQNLSTIGLVLLDLTMPRMSGAEVVAALNQFQTAVPIVLITGYGEEAVREDEKVGVVSVLQKPFTPDDLRRVLELYARASARG